MKKLIVAALCILLISVFAAYALNETEGNTTVQNVTGNLTLQSNITLQNVTGNLTAGALNATDAENATSGSTANQTNPLAAPPAVSPSASPSAKKEEPCGNGKLDTGENCFTCPKDIRCKSGAMCTDEGLCVSQGNIWLYIGIGFGIVGLVAVFIFAKRILVEY